MSTKNKQGLTTRKQAIQKFTSKDVLIVDQMQHPQTGNSKWPITQLHVVNGPTHISDVVFDISGLDLSLFLCCMFCSLCVVLYVSDVCLSHLNKDYFLTYL